MNTLIIIQARMGSSRLPGKVLMPLGESSVLDYVVTRCRKVTPIIDVIVATSRNELDDPIVEWCRKAGVFCFRGSEEDVLTRFIEAAYMYNPDYVMRVTADCPFIDYDSAMEAIQVMVAKPSDLLAYSNYSLFPRGLPIELIAYSALRHINNSGPELRHREHVTYYANEYPDKFTRTFIEVPPALRYPQLRITLDTVEDYKLCLAVAEAFRGNKTVHAADVVSYLLLHPEISTLNAHVKQKAVT